MSAESWTPFAAPDYIHTRRIVAPDVVRPWIIAGPFKQDTSAEVDGATLFESPGRTENGQALYDTAREEALAFLDTTPTEGDAATCFGIDAEWELLRVEEPMPHWGTYNPRNHLSATYLSTRITPDRPGLVRFRVRQHIYNEMLFAVNGQVQATSPEWDMPNPRWNDQEFEVVLDLAEGENTLTVAALRLARVVIGGLLLEMLDGEATIRPPLRETDLDREALERARLCVQIPRDSYRVGEKIAVSMTEPLPDGYSVNCTLVRGRNETALESVIGKTPSTLVLATAESVGQYSLSVDLNHGPDTVAKQAFDILVTAPPPELPERDNYAARCRAALEFEADGATAWSQVARYCLGRSDDIDPVAIAASCDHIRGRFDCADFQCHPLLRLMFMDRGREKLSPDVAALIRETLLNFKYWTDEPGNDTMVTGTENHRMMFHVAEYLAGILFPMDVFPNSGLTGLQHVAKARPYLMEWLAQRGRYGFNEWHSNVYYPVSLAPVLTLFDWSAPSETPLKMQARQLANLMCFTLAADTYDGIFGCTHGRTGASSVIHPETENTAGLAWLLTGRGSLNRNMGAASLAVSGFRPSPVVFGIADDSECTFTSRQRQGLPEGEGSANFIVTKTPDYALSALQDHSAFTLTRQVHVFQVTMKERAVFFFTAPNTSSESGGLRPNYWSGNSTTPRVFGHRNVAVLLYDNDEITWMTHAFIERDRFDEIEEHDNWFFARKENGYLAVWSQNGYDPGRLGPYAGREIVCRSRKNAWIVECGRKAENGSFADFTAAVSSAHPTVTGNRVEYASPSIGTVEFGWRGPATVDGADIPLSDYPLIDSPFAQSEFGSGRVTLRHGQHVEELFFNQS